MKVTNISVESYNLHSDTFAIRIANDFLVYVTVDAEARTLNIEEESNSESFDLAELAMIESHRESIIDACTDYLD